MTSIYSITVFLK